MGFRKNQKIVLASGTEGYRQMTQEEYDAHYERVRNSYTMGGRYPFMNDAGESVIVDSIQHTDLGGQTVIVVSGRAKWDLGYTWNPPKNLMRVKTEDGTLHLVRRSKNHNT